MISRYLSFVGFWKLYVDEGLGLVKGEKISSDMSCKMVILF